MPNAVCCAVMIGVFKLSIIVLRVIIVRVVALELPDVLNLGQRSFWHFDCFALRVNVTK